jgi:hypothetical protein
VIRFRDDLGGGGEYYGDAREVCEEIRCAAERSDTSGGARRAKSEDGPGRSFVRLEPHELALFDDALMGLARALDSILRRIAQWRQVRSHRKYTVRLTEVPDMRLQSDSFSDSIEMALITLIAAKGGVRARYGRLADPLQAPVRT